MANGHKPTAFLFPGQGSQKVGMGAKLAQEYEIAREVFARADELLGFSLSKLAWQGPEEELNDTINTQPALLVHSFAVLELLRTLEPELVPSYAAGHSMGEFSALVAAGSLTFDDALFLVRRRGEAMKAAGEAAQGGMAAVLGLDLPEVERITTDARATGSGIWVANDNCPGQIVISGEDAGLSAVEEPLMDAGARKFVRLAVSIPAHSPLMESAQKLFEQALESVSIQSPQVPVVGNVGASILNSVEDIRADLTAQLTNNVRWTESMQLLRSEHVDQFIELGSGNVLTGLMRRIDRKANGMNLDDPASFETLKEKLAP